jgi:hypothetical protein
MGPSIDECCDAHGSLWDHIDLIVRKVRHMPTTRVNLSRVVGAGVTAVALAAVVGAVAIGAGQQPAKAPTPTVSPTSTPTPASPATPGPTPVPTATPVGVPPVIVLDTINDQDPRLAIDDQTGRLVTARSGHGGDGMSVRWNSARVDQVDPTTIQVTWVGFPGEEDVVLTVDAKDGTPVLIFDQKAPYANTDALGADRVLILTFDSPVDATKVDVGFPSVEASF